MFKITQYVLVYLQYHLCIYNLHNLKGRDRPLKQLKNGHNVLADFRYDAICTLTTFFYCQNNIFEAVLPTKHFTMKWLFVPDESRLVSEQKTCGNGKHCHGRTQRFSEALVSKRDGTSALHRPAVFQRITE